MQRPVSVNPGERGFTEQLDQSRWFASAENSGGSSLVSPISFLDQFSVCPEALLNDPARPKLVPAVCYVGKAEKEPLRYLLPVPQSERQGSCDDFSMREDKNEDDPSAENEDDSIKQEQKKIDAATLLAFETQQRLLRDYLSMPNESGGEAASRLLEEQYVRALVSSQHRVLEQQQQQQPTWQTGADILSHVGTVDSQDGFSSHEFNVDDLGKDRDDQDDANSIASSGSFSMIGTNF